jgi:hypothetical protein
MARVWLLTTYQRKSLATSDQPVFVVPNRSLSALGMGTGIENAATIHVPLTRRHSLSMHLPGTIPAQLAVLGRDFEYPGVAATALYCNSCTVHSAWRALFHHPNDDPLIGQELGAPREREAAAGQDDLWKFLLPEDRQVLIDAGVLRELRQ